MSVDFEPALYWDTPYAIALALIEHHPGLDPESVGLNEMAELIMGLPAFRDEPGMVTERILMDVQITWYEEKPDL